MTPDQEARVPPALRERYPPRRVLGEGGFGLVFAVTDGAGGGEVALKVFKGQEGEARERFLREARLAAKIRHPNVNRVLDHGEVDGALFLVTELIQGGDLARRLKAAAGSSLGVEATVRLARDLLAGLEAIHRAGVVHRDLKPANVLLFPDGSAAITDFGLGRGGGEATMTATGQVLGTPAYMSPEQLQGIEPSAASDLYALGLILYECACGARPHSGDAGLSAMLAARLAGAHQPLETHGVGDPGLAALVGALLEAQPEERPWDTSQALALLEGGQAASGAEALGRSGAFPVDDKPSEAGGEGARRGWLLGALVAGACLAIGFLTQPGSTPAPSAPGPRPPDPRVASAREALARLRLELRGDDIIRDGTGLTAEMATEGAVATWTRARKRYRRRAREAGLREALVALAEAPIDLPTHEVAVDLARFDALLGPAVLEGTPSLWPPEEAPDLVTFLARTVRVEVVPALQPWPRRKGDWVGWELDKIGRNLPGAWVPVRTRRDLPVHRDHKGNPWTDERVKFQNLDGVVFANPIASVRTELQLLVRKVEDVDRAEAPPEVRFPLRQRGRLDLDLVINVRDFLRTQALQVEIVGASQRVSWVGSPAPPPGVNRDSTYRAPIRLRVAADHLPEGAHEVRIVGLGIQAVRPPNDFFRVGNCYQRLAGT